jgi:putative DNA primase/helicase
VADDGFDFSPLTPEERDTAAQERAPEGEPDVLKPTIPPADAEPAEAAAKRLFGRMPDAIWPYALASGETAFHVCRYNKPDSGKDYLPLCWFPGEGWRSKHWPAPRPPYTLDIIAAQPDALIVVCEGEKSADAAALIFPQSVATTSSGGAQATAKTDWAPLAGRQVRIWPDADSQGEKYARQVAAIVADFECEVSIIDAALARIDPNGGAREPRKKGWDAADAIEDWADLEALRNAAIGLAKPFEPEPATGRDYVSFEPYQMTAKGLTVEIEKGKGENKTGETVRISAPFELLGECRDPHGRAWGKLLHWRDADSREHTRHVADADLHCEPAALCAALAHEGLRIVPKRQRDLRDYLAAVRLKRRVTIVPRTGWHDIGGRNVFVLPGETIGLRGGERLIVGAAAHSPYEARGTIEEWRAGVGALAGGHVLAMLAISAALAGPLLYLAGGEGGGVHFFGQSSKGKTTILQAAASVWGRGASPGYVKAWRATANGLEGAAALATDTALVLDELGVLDVRDAGAAIYSLANGGGKQRAARDGSAREPKSWRVIFISSGEAPFEAKLTEGKGKARAGQLLRLLDVPADRGRGFGVFDNGGSEGDAGALARAIKSAASKAYGVAGPEFVRRIIAENVTGDDVRAIVAEFVSAECPAKADGQVERVAHRLGLIAAAGELATAFRLTGWREGEAREAAAWAFGAWLSYRGGPEPAEARQAIEQVRRFIEAHGDSRFDPDIADVRPSPNRAGWRKGEGDEREWLIPPESWKSEICAGLDAVFVARTLHDKGMLERASDGFQPVRKIGGGNKRVYVANARILAGGGRDA